jgi:hypothetical protein
MLDRVQTSTEKPAHVKRIWFVRLGWAASGQCVEVLHCVSSNNLECAATWIRPDKDRAIRGRSLSFMVSWTMIDSRSILIIIRLAAVMLNSSYSFYWDVTKDWDLTLFSSSRERNNPEHPWGLRRKTHFHSSSMYYTVIVIDFCLRCTWSLKLSPHLDHWNDLEGSIFAMEFLEVLRRWIWIFFRVETEWGTSANISLLFEHG